jgi:hypothetical protein
MKNTKSAGTGIDENSTLNHFCRILFYYSKSLKECKLILKGALTEQTKGKEKGDRQHYSWNDGKE